MLKQLPIVLAQLKVGNTYENLLNEIKKSHIVCIGQNKLLKKYNSIMSFKKV